MGQALGWLFHQDTCWGSVYPDTIMYMKKKYHCISKFSFKLGMVRENLSFFSLQNLLAGRSSDGQYYYPKFFEFPLRALSSFNP